MDLHTVEEIKVQTGIEPRREIFIVSDLHFMDRSRHDRFAPCYDLFCDFAQAVSWDLFFAGDGPDIWRTPLRIIQMSYPKLIARMKHGVRGNHDRRFKQLPKGYARLGKVVVAHGQKGDPGNSQWRFVGRTATWISSRLGRLFPTTPGWLNLSRRLSYIDIHMDPWRRRVFRKFPEAVALVHGHDHYACVYHEVHGARSVMSDGTWAEGLDQCHTVRLRHDSITLMRAVA